MEKFLLEGTYGYKNFVDNETKGQILNWINENIESFRENEKGPSRKFRVLSEKDKLYDVVHNIKSKIIDTEQIRNWKPEPSFGDYIGINYQGAFIHQHVDINEGKLIHTRWNLILSYPNEGGHSIYDGKINVLEENMIWKCEAGKYQHGSVKVIGDKPRITLSLGFLI